MYNQDAENTLDKHTIVWTTLAHDRIEGHMEDEDGVVVFILKGKITKFGEGNIEHDYGAEVIRVDTNKDLLDHVEYLSMEIISTMRSYCGVMEY